ncbi:S-adenosyl-L-methionine-dependent methyltransferase [Pseudomassariella vexata]|uniref:S-adenosyl-L-methionine-dependent methyltransferase n=1 Tax=Pseudomassariella vexata TaxID=1141098 RepID=A0A1Y2EC02_9PEZI|nr:S-adenosyl-L-methionine-dependent methyltransferase [Pseudomassariella vexata]ORY68834.1 S-adenosyl-L-methionine-dependent methyltransferase [Pseudomassariella vexata]
MYVPNHTHPSLYVMSDLLTPRQPDPNNSPDYQTVTSSITRYRLENGRTYHAYQDGSYMFPNDLYECDRLDWQYYCIKHLMGGELHFAPFSQNDPPRKVLDIGTGTGIWAVDMGDEYPTARIIGTDLTPIQPDYVPPNVIFEIDDCLQEWRFRELFDFVHLRCMLGSIRDFKDDIAVKAFDHLEPGGWLEAQELHCSIQCDDNTMPPDFPPKVHFDDLEDATASEQRPLRIAHTYAQGMRDAGFVDVVERTYKIPINSWPINRKYKELGKMWEENFAQGISAFSMAPLHRIRGLNRKQIEIMLIDVRKGLSDQSVHAYQKFYVVWGRKPYPGEVPEPRGEAEMTDI